MAACAVRPDSRCRGSDIHRGSNAVPGRFRKVPHRGAFLAGVLDATCVATLMETTPTSSNDLVRQLQQIFDRDPDGLLSNPVTYAFLESLARHMRLPGAESTPGTIGGTVRTLGQTVDPLRHNTDFLTMRGSDGRTLYAHEYAGYSPERRAEVRAALKARGYTHIYLYAMNEGDYGGRTVFNWYDDPNGFRGILAELNADGIAPVVWLAPDDAPRFHRDSAQTLPGTWNSFIPTIDDQVSSYVVGLKMDEYWSENEQDALGRHLDTLTDRPLFVHFRSGVWKGATRPWVDGLIYQYGFGLTVKDIEDRTRQLRAQLEPLGKTLIAGEYAHQIDETLARRLGAAALRAGAYGTGNGA